MINPHIQSIFLFEDCSTFENSANTVILNPIPSVRVNHVDQEVNFFIGVMVTNVITDAEISAGFLKANEESVVVESGFQKIPKEITFDDQATHSYFQFQVKANISYVGNYIARVEIVNEGEVIDRKEILVPVKLSDYHG